MKRPHCVLFAILLCSCTGPTGPGEGKTPESGRLRFLDRSNPLVEHTFQIMEIRAAYSKSREYFRAQGLRVCEEGEHGTNWAEDCRRCWCEWGARDCTRVDCRVPSAEDELEAERNYYARAMFDSELREMYPARPVRGCSESEHGPATRWYEGCNTCWCEHGVRSCTTGCAPPPISAVQTFELPPGDYREDHRTLSEGDRLCTEEENERTSWQWGCNTCWCEAGFRVCSKADCPAPP